MPVNFYYYKYICIGKPYTIIKEIMDEKSAKSDAKKTGLIHMFLLAAPKPPLFNSCVSTDKKTCSLETVLYSIKSFHESPVAYTFSENGKKWLKKYNDEFTQAARKWFETDSFVRYKKICLKLIQILLKRTLKKETFFTEKRKASTK